MFYRTNSIFKLIIPFSFMGLFGASDAFAAGASIAEQGAGAAGIGGAATARADLADAIYYNPAALSLGPHKQWHVRGLLGASLLGPTIEHRAPDGTVTQADSSVTPIPRLYLGGSIDRVGFGVALHAPFGSGVMWPEDWVGKYELQESNLSVLEASGVVSVRIIDGISIAAGGRVQRGQLGIRRAIDVVDPERAASVQISADDTALGGSVALMAQPVEWLTIGLTGRTATTMEFSGEADFKDVPIELEESARDTRVRRAEIVLPPRAALGASVRFGASIVQADFEYFGWQRTQEFVIDFEDEGIEDVRQDRSWRPSFAGRFGYEHRLLDDQVALRVGGFVDDTPVPASTLGASSPDGLRLGGALGAGWTSPLGVGVQGSATWTRIGRRDVRDPDITQGSYGGSLWAVSVDATMNLGR